MKIQTLKNNNNFKGASYHKIGNEILRKTANKFAKMGEIGEGTSIACDFFGKALVVPLIIMATSKEAEDKKEFSAFKNPVAATIQLALEVPVLAAGSKIIGDCANKGMFDIKNSDFSYNEKLKKDEFLNVFKENTSSSEEISQEFLDEIKSKGYSSKTQEQLDDAICNLDEPTKKIIKKSFKEYEKAFKNQFHLKNRLCFLAALILTPLLCAIENKVHPPIMEKIFKLQHFDKKQNILNKSVTFDEFIKKTSVTKRAAK